MLADDWNINDAADLARSAHDTLLELADASGDLLGFDTDVNLPTGKAISPRDAATCMLDTVRTRKFVRGLRDAVHSAKARFPDTRIDILYAGCGPFATLALPVCNAFDAGEISFTFLDGHEAAIRSVRSIVEKLGFGDHTRDFVVGDATEFSLPGTFHIVVAEMMQRALDHEPQVAATLHLAKALVPDGVFIPEEITIDLCLTDLAGEFGQEAALDRIGVGRIFNLSKNTSKLRPVSVTLPPDVTGRCLLLATVVRVFRDEVIGERESGARRAET